MIALLNTCAAVIYTYVTTVSIFILMQRLDINILPNLFVSALFTVAVCTKEYAKMHTSSLNGVFSDFPDGRLKKKYLAVCCVLCALFCAVGLESVFITSTFLAIQAKEGIGSLLRWFLYAAVIIFSIMNLPIDLVFYWNCLRKLLRLNNQSTAQKKLKQIYEISAFCSSTYFFSVR